MYWVFQFQNIPSSLRETKYIPDNWTHVKSYIWIAQSLDSLLGMGRIFSIHSFSSISFLTEMESLEGLEMAKNAPISDLKLLRI